MRAEEYHQGMRATIIAMATACAVAAPGLAAAQVELRNDGFETGMSAGFQAGFVSGEIGAVRLVAPQASVQVLSVRLLFGGATTTQTITLKIWDDSAGTVAPGVELFSGDFQLAGNNTVIHELDVAGMNVIVPMQFRVGIQFQHAGLPAIARDDDGTINASRNFINASGIGWIQSQSLGLTGDWVIRAMVSTGGGPDAGSGGPDAGSGGPDAGTGGPDAGSATCTGNGDCPLGEYCDTMLGSCTFDCRLDSDCPGGGPCNSLGQCLAADGDGGGCCSTARDRGGAAGPLAASGLALLVALTLTRRRRRR